MLVKTTNVFESCSSFSVVISHTKQSDSGHDYAKGERSLLLGIVLIQQALEATSDTLWLRKSSS